MEHRARLIERACNLALSLLESDIDYLDNVIELNSIGNTIYDQCWGTEFHVFGVIASDTDHLPTKKVRQHCSSSILEKSDKELKQIIESYKLDTTKGCNEILSKYKSI